MAKKKRGPGGGRPQASARTAVVVRAHPCPRCTTGELRRGQVWCLGCSNRARARGHRNRPAALTRQVVEGVARALGFDTTTHPSTWPIGPIIEELR